MKFCMECGTRLEEKSLKHEGLIPLCPKCNVYHFPVFSMEVSMIVMNQKQDKKLLIKQYKSNPSPMIPPTSGTALHNK